MNWRAVCKKILIILLFILLSLEICMEVRYPCDEIVLKSEDTAAILRKTPEAEITEEDKAFLEEVSQCPNVRKLLEGGEDGFIFAEEDPDVGAVAAAYLGAEKADSLTVNVNFQENGDVAEWSNWGESGNDIFILQRTRGGDGTKYFKIYSYSGFFGSRSTYENWDNERAHESGVRRRWFAWLRDRMWEDR